MIIKGGTFYEMAKEIISRDKKIIIYGAGALGTVTVPEILWTYGLERYVMGYVDNDARKWGTQIRLKETMRTVYPSEWLYDNSDENTIIFITISRYAEILEELENKECMEDVYCYLIPMMCIYNFKPTGGKGVIKSSDKPVIPKTIHYMWMGGSPIPDNLKYCIDSWRKYCPDFEIIRWDESNYDVKKHPYMEMAYASGMYGFIPDYARLDILHKYGGIYMDTDVEVIRPLDDILYQSAFCSVEKWQILNFGGCSGAMKRHPAIKELLQERQRISFINSDGSLNKNTCGYYDTKVMLRNGYKINGLNQTVMDMNIYTYDYFHPYDYISRRVEKTDDTFSIHHFNGGWLDAQMKKANEETSREFEALYRRLYHE